MSKQYGLIDPKSCKSKIGFAKHAAFESDSDSDSGPKKSVNLELGESQKRQVKAAQQKAMAEDPTIYQYDELYDEMDTKRKEAKVDKSKEERKPKYINKLLETAEKRKLEQERRIERQVQKEREAEGELYKDKESFVTSAYRAKLEEINKAEEEEKREEYLESIADVTKQNDLGGFYRHIFSQKMGESSQKKEQTKDVQKDSDCSDSEKDSKRGKGEKDKERDNSENKELAEINTTKSKDAMTAKSRRYRKRRSDEEDNDDTERNDSSKKVHLHSNLDADSDFSIDSNSSSSSESDESSDSSDSETSGKERDKAGSTVEKSPKKKTENAEPAPNGNESDDKVKDFNGTDNTKDENKADKKVTKQKEPKIDIWKKRTVGAVFDSALQRYYERKAVRESG